MYRINLKHAPAGASAADVTAEKLRKQQNTRADALVSMATQSLEGLTINGNTADRFQVVARVDSLLLSGEEHVKSTGEPDCYIEKEVVLPRRQHVA